MFRFFIVCAYLLTSLIFLTSSAYSESVPAATTALPLCSNLYEINGPDQLKIGSTHEFSLHALAQSDVASGITYTLKRGSGTIATSVGEKYVRSFAQPGEVVLEVGISGICDGLLQKKIRVYETIITYVGSDRVGGAQNINNLLERNHILYKSYFDKGGLQGIDDSQGLWADLEKSDIFIVGSSDILSFFSQLVKLQKSKQMNFTKKKIYIISDLSKPFLSKVLASSLSQIGSNSAFVISDDQFHALLTYLSIGDSDGFNLGQELSYEKSRASYTLSGFLELLTYSGFSYQFLASILSLTFIVLALNILKQVVGFHVFGIYYPVLMALIFSAIGWVAMVLGGIAIISIFIVNAFVRKVHLLIHAKRALLISIYGLLLLFVLGVDNFFDLSIINYAIFDNPFIIFPFVMMIMIVERIIQEDTNVVSKSGLLDLLQYFVVALIVYFLFEYKLLQYFLISYPDVIIFAVIFNIVVGRYMGLQVFEYFRFTPLLRKLNEEE